MSIEVEVYNDKIFYFKNVIPNAKDIVEFLEKDIAHPFISKWLPWGNAYAFSLEQAGDLAPRDFGFTKCIYPTHGNNNEENSWVYDSIDKGVKECSKMYSKLLNIDETENPRLPFGGYVIGRYNDKYGNGMHTDCPYDDLEHSYVIYYNDDYENGELYFPSYDLKIKPEAGSVVMFKSSDVENDHEAIPANGYKYVTPHFWRMGPSKGFVPYGENLKDYISSVTVTNAFESLKSVEERKKEFLSE